MSYPPQQQVYDGEGEFAGAYSGSYSAGPQLPPGVQPPPNLPPGARYQTTVQNPVNGAVIDRYVVPQRGKVPVRSVVPEQQQYQVKGQVMVPEKRHIQVPKTIMVPEKYTVMVPQVRTRMVPKITSETKAVMVQKPVATMQNMVRTVQKVIEGQKIVQSYQVIEYERPKMIQGRFLGQKQAPIQEVGVQWTGHYYAGRSKVTPTSPPMMYQGAQSEHGMHAPPGMAYDDAAGYNTEMYGPSGGNYATNPGPYAYGADPAALV